ncbi:MAG: hypothetical protein SF187_04285 [Deltaproteobacteria bacterium]|nr:hypothetical protein [Deltaproteobacteria bacterium]
MQARLFRLKYQVSDDVIKAVRPLASGAKGSKIADTSAFESISIFDYPANVAAVADAIRQLDVPVVDVAIRVHVLLATSDGEAAVPKTLAAVVAELQRSLPYRSYHELVAVVQRVRSGAWFQSNGDVLLKPPLANEPSNARYAMKMQATATVGPGKLRDIVVRGVDFDFDTKGLGSVDINTDFTVRPGETVVVGTATLKERAVVLVVAAEIK